jgi:hypothetical protein
MTLEEFINYRPHCFICKAQTSLILSFMATETFDSDKISISGIFRKPKITDGRLTFRKADFAVLEKDKDHIDSETVNIDKYKALSFADNAFSFEKKFDYKARVAFTMGCPNRHCLYSSRRIKISNKSSDITKGYPVVSEILSYNKYVITTDEVAKDTFIFTPHNDEPIRIPYQDIADFGNEDEDQFVNKIQKILLLS